MTTDVITVRTSLIEVVLNCELLSHIGINIGIDLELNHFYSILTDRISDSNSSSIYCTIPAITYCITSFVL